MSAQASTWVWEHSQANGGDLLLLLVLADNVGTDSGEGRLPDYDKLIQRCRFQTVADVRASLFALMDLGELDVGELPGDTPDQRPWFTIKPLAVTR